MELFTLLHSNNIESQKCLILIKHLQLANTVKLLNISKSNLFNKYIKTTPILIDNKTNSKIDKNILEFIVRLSKYIHEEQPYSKKDIYVTLDDMHKYQNNIVTETESEEQSKIEFEKNYQNLLNCRNI